MARTGWMLRASGLLAAVAIGAAAVHAAGRPAPHIAARSTASPSLVSPSIPTSTTTTGSNGVPTSPTGPGLTSEGIDIRAQVAADGALDVVETVRLGKPLQSLRLAAPVAPAGIKEDLQPVVTDLQAQTDQGPVETPGSLNQMPWPVTFDRPVTSFVLRYRMSSGGGRSNPAPVGRALLVLGPVSAPDLQDAPVVARVLGTRVLNLTCPSLPPARQVCGVAGPSGRSAGPISAQDATMVAQVDLPAPGST